MNSFDDIYNNAVDFSIEGVPADVPIGVARLADVHRVFNAIMSGGLGFAREIVEAEEFRRGIEGFRYLGLNEVADLLGDLTAGDQTSDAEERKEARLNKVVNEGDLVLEAFRRKVAEVPIDFGVEG